jgi:catechol 2,3-dioxygenase-like lactoylglutathione lyase family enzyme
MKLQEIKLSTNDINATASFYKEVLQLEPIFNVDYSISIEAGRSVLTFIQNDDIETPVYHFAFNIPQNQLEQAIEWAKGRVELLRLPENKVIADFENWNAKAIYFLDNNGNILEFIARYDLRNKSDQTFSTQAIECISEIGVATDQVSELADQLIAAYDLPVFAKQPRDEKFTALGDDEGLLILAEFGRNWFPTQIPADSFPMEIVIDDKYGKKVLSL